MRVNPTRCKGRANPGGHFWPQRWQILRSYRGAWKTGKLLKKPNEYETSSERGPDSERSK